MQKSFQIAWTHADIKTMMNSYVHALKQADEIATKKN